MKKSMSKKLSKLLRAVLALFLTCVLGFICLLGFLWVTEYRPAPVEYKAIDTVKRAELPAELKLLIWNIGYGGLGAESDFFMDGGRAVMPPGRRTVEKNLRGIMDFLQANPVDFCLLQEVDRASKRSFDIDEGELILKALTQDNRDESPLSLEFAPNYQCRFVPYPWPPIGHVKSGLCTLSRFSPESAERRSLPVPFRFPVRLVNLKRCLLVTRYPCPNGHELVLVNLHLEAYDDGEGKLAQTKVLADFVQSEYEKGNYVIAGGDWNQAFDEDSGIFQGEVPEGIWEPGLLPRAGFDPRFQLVTDPRTPSFRVLNRPYQKDSPGTYTGIIDGFLLSPNVRLIACETQDLDFQFSDHQPILLTVKLDDFT